ncbi:MAG: SDR family oxidoreductase [Rhodospirillaceae bacterium]|jgi:NAD(P)-dependent dehydrogenase (short-subunit alcohol dehydrogenase family)|nr:SDR family oxidoreductase [Rhodospirillaceae bacterium]MBT4487176.1 SDR family oxidoreductase [Rhodospirillaceae bacterium]MBT5195069.1 SDR family oxidoreductase [Rhodospirillaceae bacterium]MBT5895467.1 SDR family oxidoreductase [Rhodospirillaceae bacterium]MBT6426897.1 SDR family oxidoreductase [Rhodospirillaceae bacterium]
MSGRLQDKVALICGAGSIGPGWGNGKATAAAFAREGAKVFAVDLNLEAAAETVAVIKGEGHEAIAYGADVSDPDGVANMVAACQAAYGRVDILHNNVGIASLGGPLETSLEQWERVMRINITSMFLTCQAVLPLFLEQGGGAIVNVSSLSAVKAARPELAYATSKGAVNALTINIAMEFADRNIRCNALVPGLINTPMVADAMKDIYGDGGIEAMVAARDALSPTGKMGEGWDVANAAVFLASDEARYINGMLLHVDGGLQHLFTAGQG